MYDAGKYKFLGRIFPVETENGSVGDGNRKSAGWSAVWNQGRSFFPFLLIQANFKIYTLKIKKENLPTHQKCLAQNP